MRCPQCGFEQADGSLECLKCGVIFARYRPKAAMPRGPDQAAPDPTPEPSENPAYTWHPTPEPGENPAYTWHPTPEPGENPAYTWHPTPEPARAWDTPADAPMSRLATRPSRLEAASAEHSPSWRTLAREICLPPPTSSSWVALIGRSGLYLILCLWGGYFILHGVDAEVLGQSFMHRIHIPFHEAGHVFFSFFGEFLTYLGGTLGQLLMPLICLLTLLLRQRDAFGASVCLWWLGQSLLDCTPYINDARDLQLTLLGGISAKDSAGHDWENILSMTGLLIYDHRLAQTVFLLGSLTLLLAFAWGLALLAREVKDLRSAHR